MKKSWWKEAVIYQIYPRSFNDSNGDGVGDLKGITEKLPYLADLGVDVLWLSPIFQSPNDDNGYDIKDYRGIMDEFGTMEDFDELLKTAHDLGLKILLDLVVNHSSDEHAWFQESRKSKDNPYRDYYIWRDEPLGNWHSFFGGSAWKYDEVTQQYFLHLFTKKQPDLNWENPKLRQEVYDLMNFWYEKGIDGFRMDVITLISKRLDFPEIDPNNMHEAIYDTYANGPRVHEFLQEMYENTSSNYDVMTVGECVGVTKELVNDYTGKDRGELNMLYHFDHMFMDWGQEGKYDVLPIKLSDFKSVFREWHESVGEDGWINVFLDNHDFPRMVSRFATDGEHRVEAAKLLATLLLSLRGTPCIYQGSEIGMTNVAFPSLDDYDDVETMNTIAAWKAEGRDLGKLLKAVHYAGRDNARTPVQWDDSENGGFTTGKPWIKVNPNYPEINVKNALANPNSIFYFYKEMLKVRKAHKTLVYGDYLEHLPENEQIYAYRRKDEAGEYLVVLNFSDEEFTLKGDLQVVDYELIIGNYGDQQKEKLRAWESRVYKV